MEENLLNQVYQAEKDYIGLKNQYETYVSSELQAYQQKKVFEYTLDSLKEIDTNKVYQPLGKAFIVRDKSEVIEDLEYLQNKAGEDLENAKKYKEIFGLKKAEFEKQLIEMTKNLNLTR